MTSELQQSCEYASVEDAQVTNTFFPNSENKNVATVKFTATVKVKIDGKLADDLRKYRTASALYSEYGNEMIELNRSHKEAMDAIEKARKAAQDKYMAQLNIQGFNAADRDKNDEAMRELYGQKDALSKESAAKANGIFDKYKDRAENLLYPNTTGSVRRYEPPSEPEIPLACFGYRDPRTALGILYKSVLDSKGSSDDYYAGVETSIEGERKMIKTDNGWMVAGNL